jgi:GAF domain-containing protein
VLVLDRATAMHWGMAEPIVRAGACDRVLGAEEVGEALRAWFTPCDILESAELQFRLGELLENALRLAGTRLGHVQLLDAPTRVLRVVAYRGFEKRVVDRFDAVDDAAEAACSRALRSGRRVVIEDVEADPHYRPYLDVARAVGYRAVQATPLFTTQARVGGIISTHFPSARGLDPHEARVLDEIARSAQPLVSRMNGAQGG